MKEYSPSQIKNIVVLGHQGSGKTSLMESVLLKSNTIAKKGSVDAGTSPKQIKKSVASLIHVTLTPWKGCD